LASKVWCAHHPAQNGKNPFPLIATWYEIQNYGMMIVVSSIDMDINEVVPLYYSRQTAEQLFGISEDDLNILPIRTHSEERLRVHMLWCFVVLI